MGRWAIVAVVLLVSACDSVMPAFVPDVTCAGWRNLDEDQRSAVAAQIIAADGLVEAVRVAQQAPPGTPEAHLVAMASGSITKACELERWSPAIRVRDVARALYSASRGRPVLA
jgi:hypothetical protein